ncbi:MAG: hypothetical protein AAGE18_08770 [Pseudomonadota bacterium]
MVRLTRPLALLAALLLPSVASADAARVDVVIERSGNMVEIFFGLPAEGLVDVFALPPEHLVQEDGTVDFEPLRRGTWQIGEAVFAGVEATIGGAPAGFEAMSLMVHPADAKLPLRDGIDGIVAIGVCNVEAPEVPPTLSDLHAYIGLVAYPEDTSATVSLRLPETGIGPIELSIRDHTAGRLTAAYTVELEEGAELVLAPGSDADRLPGGIGTVLLGAFALVALIGATRRVRS